MSDMGLKQLIKEMMTDMRTAIGHIYSNVESIMCGISETYFSFHRSIWVALLWIVNGGAAWVLWAQRSTLRKALPWIVKGDTAWVLWVQRSALRKASLYSMSPCGYTVSSPAQLGRAGMCDENVSHSLHCLPLGVATVTIRKDYYAQLFKTNTLLRTANC